jgi:hypothetical protein
MRPQLKKCNASEVPTTSNFEQAEEGLVRLITVWKWATLGVCCSVSTHI